MNPLGLFLEPLGPLFTYLHTVYIAYSERLPTSLNPPAERTCFSQVRAAAAEGAPPPPPLVLPPAAEDHFDTPFGQLVVVKGKLGSAGGKFPKIRMAAQLVAKKLACANADTRREARGAVTYSHELCQAADEETDALCLNEVWDALTGVLSQPSKEAVGRPEQ